MRKNILTFLVASALLSGVGACAQSAEPTAATAHTEPLTIVTDTGSHAFNVEIADDEEERQRGLMNRPPLAEDQGMLFQFPDSRERSFWMRNTPSSLDIIYVDETGHIVSIARNTTPFSEISIPSNGPALGVIELRAGRAAEISADPGDRVEHAFFGTD